MIVRPYVFADSRQPPKNYVTCKDVAMGDLYIFPIARCNIGLRVGKPSQNKHRIPVLDQGSFFNTNLVYAAIIEAESSRFRYRGFHNNRPIDGDITVRDSLDGVIIHRTPKGSTELFVDVSDFHDFKNAPLLNESRAETFRTLN